jgi:radical SAM-linked protein
MKDYRIVFEKRGRVRYISHLDLNRCMLRAVRRSGLPAWYTEGFHPHMYLMFPLALSLGAESICEVMDLRLTEEVQPEEILARLNPALPEGLRAYEVREPKNVTQDIGSAEYEITLAGEGLAERWEAFFAQEQILTEKKTKKGMKEIDIKPLITVEHTAAEDGVLHLTLRLPAGNEGNINVSVVTDAFAAFVGMPVLVREVLRTKIFCLDGGLFF